MRGNCLSEISLLNLTSISQIITRTRFSFISREDKMKRYSTIFLMMALFAQGAYSACTEGDIKLAENHARASNPGETFRSIDADDALLLLQDVRLCAGKISHQEYCTFFEKQIDRMKYTLELFRSQRAPQETLRFERLIMEKLLAFRTKCS